MAKKAKPSRKYHELPPQHEEESDTKYFAPEPIEDVDKDVTKFLLEESPDKGRPKRGHAPLEEPEGQKDMTNWYILATVFVLLIVIITYYVNVRTSGPVKEEPEKKIEAKAPPQETETAANETPSVPSPDITGLQDLVLNTSGLRPVEDFEELDDNKADLINDCNDSTRCMAVLKGYQKIGLRTESKSYTVKIDKDGRIVDLKTGLEADTNFVVDASEEDLVGLYNGLATNDEDIVLLKLQKVMPPDFLRNVLQGMMAG